MAYGYWEDIGHMDNVNEYGQPNTQRIGESLKYMMYDELVAFTINIERSTSHPIHIASFTFKTLSFA